jgi:hypothetical protein
VGMAVARSRIAPGNTPGRVLLGYVVFAGGLLWTVRVFGGSDAVLSWLQRWWPAVVLGLLLTTASSLLGAWPFARRVSTSPPILAIAAVAAVLLLALGLTTGLVAGWTAGRAAPLVVCGIGLALGVTGWSGAHGGGTEIAATAWFRRLHLTVSSDPLVLLQVRAVGAVAELDLTGATPRDDCELQLTCWFSTVTLIVPQGVEVQVKVAAGPGIRVEGRVSTAADAVGLSLLGAYSVVRVRRA